LSPQELLTVIVAGFVQHPGNLVVHLLVVFKLGREPDRCFARLLCGLENGFRVGRSRVEVVTPSSGDGKAEEKPYSGPRALLRSRFGGIEPSRGANKWLGRSNPAGLATACPKSRAGDRRKCPRVGDSKSGRDGKKRA